MSYYENFASFDYKRPYSLDATEKTKLFLSLLNELTDHHLEHSPSYAKIVKSLFNDTVARRLEDVPFIPVRLFKHLDFLSMPRADIFKTLTSSGTTGQSVSKIFLSRDNSSMQTKILGSVLFDFLGSQRLPMVVIDSEDILKDRINFNARAAGTLGFSVYGKDHVYALNAAMETRMDILDEYCAKYRNNGIYAFGFTFVIWKYLYQFLEKTNSHLDFGPLSILIHGGGWKKLGDESVSNSDFKAKVNERLGLRRVHNYYGMVEQAGSIFMECQHGHLHSSNYSDVIIRNPMTFNPCPVGEQGLVQVISLLPYSYPGHSLLTEDLGVLLGVDDCPCGRAGKYFHVHGRLKSSEPRGCSDVRQF